MNFIFIFLFVLLLPFVTSVAKADLNEPKTSIKGSSNQVMPLTETDTGEQTELESSELELIGYKLKIKGFLSAAGGFTTAKQYTSSLNGALINPSYYGLWRRISFESDSLAGLQLNAPVTENTEMVIQLVARGRATDRVTDKYELNANWAYLNYQIRDNLSLKIGRVLTPVYLLSQYVDVAYAYPWVKPPQEIYGSVPVPSSNGVMVNWQIGLSEEWQLELVPFFISNTTKTLYPLSNVTTDLDLDNFLGLSANVTNDWFKLSAIYMTGKLMLNRGNAISFSVPSLGNLVLPGVDVNTSYASVGIRAERNNALVMAEIALRRSPGSYLRDVRSWYVLGGYQIQKVMPYVTYAEINSLNKDRLNSLSQALQAVMSAVLFQEQRSVEVGMRYDVVDNIAIKASFTHIEPLNGSRGLFDDVPAQKTVNVFNAGVNLVF